MTNHMDNGGLDMEDEMKPKDGLGPDGKLGNTVPFPLPFPLSNLRQKKHRYMGMIVGFEQSASLCQEMERQDIEVFSVNAFPQPLSPGHIAMAAFVMGRVDKDRPPTDLEKTSEEESKRLIQPAVNRPDFNGNGRKK